MSENQELENGQKVIPACLFCGAKFVESQALDENITCQKESGGCGLTFKLLLINSVIKPLKKDE